MVGISFALRDDRVRISGDISGDESGFVYFDEGCTIETTRDLQGVLDGAREITARIAAEERLIVEAIQVRHPRAVPG